MNFSHPGNDNGICRFISVKTTGFRRCNANGSASCCRADGVRGRGLGGGKGGRRKRSFATRAGKFRELLRNHSSGAVRPIKRPLGPSSPDDSPPPVGDQRGEPNPPPPFLSGAVCVRGRRRGDSEGAARQEPAPGRSTPGNGCAQRLIFSHSPGIVSRFKLYLDKMADTAFCPLISTLD
ncbi:hypothetical protein GWI33_002897 [Rhynchophorus ferrugineus]|uniref:Uncharacterized protein n=1 Tax=Rhynchophorus ferrugineus TaxID=354439 RepID=A0A834IQQ7_RHYFE|nr:hypothetical protein GWI33_002897 [Rhynchophorus ferrugineus]